MLTTLPLPTSSTGVHSLLSAFDNHLVVPSILAGGTPGQLFADDPAAPSVALAGFRHHLFLAGGTSQASVVSQGIEMQVLPGALQAGLEALLLHIDTPAWQPLLQDFFPGRTLIPAVREFYACTSLSGDWRLLLPPGMQLLPADSTVLDRLDPAGRELLSEEMCSERVSVADFLEKSFGVCLVQGSELVGFCLSEYNTAGRCEVGVATMEPYQQRGLGTLMSLALVEEALRRGLTTVGWHCWQKNLASAALARKAGFSLVETCPVTVVLLKDEA